MIKNLVSEHVDIRHLSRALSLSLFILAAICALYLLLFVNRTPPNTYLGNLNISAKNERHARENVSSYLESYQNQEIVFVAGSKKLEVTMADAGAVLDRQRSLDLVFKKKGLFEGLGEKISSLLIVSKHAPIYDIDFDKLNQTVDSIFEVPASDAAVEMAQGKIVLKQAKNGIVIDRPELVSGLRSRLDSLTADDIKIVYIGQKPKISNEQAKRVLVRVKELEGQSITLKFAQDSWTLSGENLFSLLAFTAGDEEHTTAQRLQIGGRNQTVADYDFSGKPEPVLEVTLNSNKLDSYIGDIAKVLDKPKVDATLEFDGTRVTQFTSAQDGQKLDRALTRSLVSEAVSVKNPRPEKNITINLPVNVDRAQIANEKVNALGIKELIASGVSYFAGSIPNRISNIELGSKLINGTIVAPGEVYSFVKLAGPVSAEQGFKQAYVISKGRTVLDDGGGICQVSTTVFRAVLNAGLPILERTAHAYRVSYYEQRGFKPGFDATIFSPSVDLKFKNDTDHHILVQVNVDRQQARIQVDIYGTRDDRRVEISEPVLSNPKPAPEPLHQDDPTLPKGVTKQVDFAAAGLASVFTRKVYKGPNLMIEDTIKSVFRPWQAVYLVGTGG